MSTRVDRFAWSSCQAARLACISGASAGLASARGAFNYANYPRPAGDDMGHVATARGVGIAVAPMARPECIAGSKPEPQRSTSAKLQGNHANIARCELQAGSLLRIEALGTRFDPVGIDELS